MTTEEYDDQQMVVCDRKSAITKSDDGLNNTWTNSFNGSIQLKPGDRIAVYNSFISEKGAGTPESIEFKDILLDGQKTLNYTKTQTLVAGDPRNNTAVAESGLRFWNHYTDIGGTGNGYSDRFRENIKYMDYIENKDETIEQKDNSCSLVINYYKTMDGLCLYQLPRRWSNENFFNLDGSAQNNPLRWQFDDTFEFGRTRAENVLIGEQQPAGTTRFFEIDAVYGYVLDDYKIILDFQEEVAPSAGPPPIQGQVRQGRAKRLILKNDNSRMSVMMRKKNLFYPSSTRVNQTADDVPPVNNDLYYDFIPPYYAMDPEFHEYVIYREKIDLALEPGFTSAQYVSEELTRQLRSSKLGTDDITTIERDEGSFPLVADDVRTLTPIEKFVETSTYRKFLASNDYYGQKKYYDETIDNSTPPANPGDPVGVDGPTSVVGVANPLPPPAHFPNLYFYQQYQFIGTKRPDLVKAGQELNDIFGFRVDVPGGNQQKPYFEANPVITNIPYNDATLLKLKNFLDAQALYPELFRKDNIKNLMKPNIQTTIAGTGENIYYQIIRTAIATGFITDEFCYVNINNARYLHMNQYDSKFYNNLLQGDVKLTNPDPTLDPPTRAGWGQYAQLGCSYYDWRGHQITNSNTGATDNTAYSRDLNDPLLSDSVIPAGAGFDKRLNSLPFFFHYDPTQKDTLYADADANDETMKNENYTYGCFGRHSITGGVVIYPNKLLNTRTGTGVGLPKHLFTTPVGLDLTIESGRKVGYDRHWNAWGTATIALTSGIPRYEFKKAYDATKPYADTDTQNGVMPPLVSNPVIGSLTGQIQGIYSEPGQAALVDKYQNQINQHLPNVYLGADSPSISYDGSHFSFFDLHTPLNKGNLNTLEAGTPSGDEAQVVYKINPQQHYNSWSPSLRPYEETIEFAYKTGGGQTTRRRVNRNLDPFQVYDTTTGIFIEDFGYNEDVWTDSLWGRLGFTYGQLHNNDVPDRQKRYTDFTDTSNILTTNADVKSKDIKSWQQNKFGQAVYSNTLFHGFQFRAYDAGISSSAEAYLDFLPEVIAPTTSVSVVAKDYPTQVNNGFYAIKCDLALNTNAVMGYGDTSFPIVGIADKTNAIKDFFISSPSSISHTITRPITISSITTQIADPNGTLARCSPNSVVIYRITKTRDTSFNILGDLERKLQELEEEKQKIKSQK